MARLKRLIVPQLPHLVQQRVVAGCQGLSDAVDQQAYALALRDCCDAHEVTVIAYALPSQQALLLLVPPSAESLGKMVQALTRQFVGPFNRRHQRSGALWQGRFCSAPLESATELLNAVIRDTSATLSTRTRAAVALAATEPDPRVSILASSAASSLWSSDRRERIFTSLAAVSGALSANASSEKSESISAGFEEASMRLPLHSDADVIVCGAGPAGVG